MNCLRSEVLADGIKTSTFGKYHFIPAWWMRIVGGVVGPKRASTFGDAIVGLLVKARVF